MKRGRRRPKLHDKVTGIANEFNTATDDSEVLLPPRGRSQSETTIESCLLLGSAPDASWKAFASVSHSLLIYLVDIYFQVVYPMSVHQALCMR